MGRSNKKVALVAGAGASVLGWSNGKAVGVFFARSRFVSEIDPQMAHSR